MTHVTLAFSFTQFFVHGGFFMYLLMVCSVVSVATMILRGLALRRDTVLPPRIISEIEALPPGEGKRAITRLSQVVERDDSALGRVVHTCLNHVEWPRSENVEAVQTRARAEVIRMESGLVVLEVIVGIAPLLGLLGAVAGLVEVFGVLGASQSVSDPRGIAGGISEALNTTIAGLAVAIPSLIAHSAFSRKVENMSSQMESILSELLAKCYSRKSRLGAGRTTAGSRSAEREEAEAAPSFQ